MTRACGSISGWQNVGTQAAANHVAQQQIAAGSPASRAGWNSMHERAESFAAIREAVGEVRWRHVLDGYGWTGFAKMEAYLSRVIEGLGLDSKGKRKKLESTTITFSLRGCNKRAEIADEMAAPQKFKRVTITLPAETWELLCDSLDPDLREQVLHGSEVGEGRGQHQLGEG
jgi:hypothetical protein